MPATVYTSRAMDRYSIRYLEQSGQSRYARELITRNTDCIQSALSLLNVERDMIATSQDPQTLANDGGVSHRDLLTSFKLNTAVTTGFVEFANDATAATSY